MISRRLMLEGLAAAGAAVVSACGPPKRIAVARTGGDASAPSGAPATGGPGGTTQAPPVTAAASRRGAAAFVAHGPASSRGVALTFHTAGPPAITEDLLAQAAKLGAHLTFFVVGTWATANPAVVAAIIAGGHELGNHTWSHANIAALPPAGMQAEIDRCAGVLRDQTGSIAKWFRPSQIDVPTGAILAAAGAGGYTASVGFDVDPLDYVDPGASPVAGRVRAGLHPGAIVSLHTLYPGTAAAFGPIVSALRSRGLEPMTLSGVLGPNP